MVEFKGDASAVNQVLEGLPVVNIRPTEIYCSCCVENVDRIEFLNASFVPERTCRNTTRHRYYGFECSECKWSAYEPNDYGNDVRFDDFNYCPSCGAKVVI